MPKYPLKQIYPDTSIIHTYSQIIYSVAFPLFKTILYCCLAIVLQTHNYSLEAIIETMFLFSFIYIFPCLYSKTKLKSAGILMSTTSYQDINYKKRWKEKALNFHDQEFSLRRKNSGLYPVIWEHKASTACIKSSICYNFVVKWCLWQLFQVHL